MSVTKNGTFLIISGPAHDRDRKHLFVVCTNPCEEGNVLLVPICSCNGRTDDVTCLLEAHEHPFLRHRSFASYQHAQIREVHKIQTGIERGIIAPRQAMNGQSGLKVRNGVARSENTAERVKRYFQMNKHR